MSTNSDPTSSPARNHALASDLDRITVRVLFFGAARDLAGGSEVQFIMGAPFNAISAREQVLAAYPELRRFGKSLLFAVNQEYADPNQEVHVGDELAVFPPVSGGSGSEEGIATETERHREKHKKPAAKRGAGNGGEADSGSPLVSAKAPLISADKDFFELTTDPIGVGAIARRVVLPECGATVTLDGYAREWTKWRQTLYLVYEAYAPMALSEMQRLGQQAHEKFEIAHIGIVHRTGRLDIGETSVVVSVSAPHRRAAFEACEWAIRELKRTVPIWKKEFFEDGEVWVEGEAQPQV